MRFGIVLPRDGPLAEPAALAAAARAAVALEYDSVWVAAVAHVGALADYVGPVPLGLLLDAETPVPELADLTRRSPLSAVAAPAPVLRALRPVLATTCLLATELVSLAPHVDGWVVTAPEDDREVETGSALAGPGGRRVLLVPRAPTNADLALGARIGADELLVSVPAATTLDQQLAAFADIAERLAEPCPQPAV